MTITIIDYSLILPSVDIITDFTDVEGNDIEHELSELGYHPSNCAWLITGNAPKIIFKDYKDVKKDGRNY